MAKMIGKFMILEQVQKEKAVYLTVMDLETKGQFNLTSPVLVDEKSILVPVVLEVEGLRINRGFGKTGSYTSVTCTAIKGGKA
jgi:hypothetical protein